MCNLLPTSISRNVQNTHPPMSPLMLISNHSARVNCEVCLIFYRPYADVFDTFFLPGTSQKALILTSTLLTSKKGTIKHPLLLLRPPQQALTLIFTVHLGTQPPLLLGCPTRRLLRQPPRPVPAPRVTFPNAFQLLANLHIK